MVTSTKISELNEELLLTRRFIVRSIRLLKRLKYLCASKKHSSKQAFEIYQYFQDLDVDLDYLNKILHSKIVEHILILSRVYMERKDQVEVVNCEKIVQEDLEELQSGWRGLFLN